MLPCNHADVLQAVRSLYADELKPYGRLLLKRLREHAAAAIAAAQGLQSESIDPRTMPKVDPQRLRRLCGNSNVFLVSPEEGGEYSVRLVGWGDTFVDPTSSVDHHPPDLWVALAAYFDANQANELIFSGGRYDCARALSKLQLPCLIGRPLGQICHIVQLSISDKFLLGYRSGHLVPYRFSEESSKRSMALVQQPPERTSFHVACMEEARAAVWQLVNSDERGSVALASVKRLFKERFRMDLSETALGHANMHSLFLHPCFHDICDVVVEGKGKVALRRKERPRVYDAHAARILRPSPGVWRARAPVVNGLVATAPGAAAPCGLEQPCWPPDGDGLEASGRPAWVQASHVGLGLSGIRCGGARPFGLHAPRGVALEPAASAGMDWLGAEEGPVCDRAGQGPECRGPRWPTAAADGGAAAAAPPDHTVPFPRRWQLPAVQAVSQSSQEQVERFLCDDNLNGAEAALLQMITKGIEPTQETLGAVCKRLARTGQASNIEVIMETLELKGFKLQEGIFAALVYACKATRPQRLARAEQVVQDMHARGLKFKALQRIFKHALGKRRTQALFDAVPKGAGAHGRPREAAAQVAGPSGGALGGGGPVGPAPMPSDSAAPSASCTTSFTTYAPSPPPWPTPLPTPQPPLGDASMRAVATRMPFDSLVANGALVPASL